MFSIRPQLYRPIFRNLKTPRSPIRSIHHPCGNNHFNQCTRTHQIAEVPKHIDPEITNQIDAKIGVAIGGVFLVICGLGGTLGLGFAVGKMHEMDQARKRSEEEVIAAKARDTEYRLASLERKY